jgi:hypothetical protein
MHRSEKSRHLVLSLSAGIALPDALAAALRDERVSCGWLRASGIVADVDLRAFDAELGGLAGVRRISGLVHALSLEGPIGVVGGAPVVSLRGVLSRERDCGLETISGEIVGARCLGVDALVTVLEDLSLQRTLDESSGVWLWGVAIAPGARPADAHASAPTAGWSSALEASEGESSSGARDRPRGGMGATVPQKPVRAAAPEVESLVPEAGDSVDHFAFGPCDVLKSEGDRLHLRVHKGGRIREIALEMLRVTRLEDSGDKRCYKLERRI